MNASTLVQQAVIDNRVGARAHHPDRDDAFPTGTERVYVWFAVAVPPRYRQAVRFEWYRDSEPAGRVIETFVVVGRCVEGDA